MGKNNIGCCLDYNTNYNNSDICFLYRISSQNRKHKQLETEIKQQMKDAVNDYANDYGNVVPILESYPDGNGKCGFRLSESGSDKTEKSYELEATKDAGKKLVGG